jgi:site-specific recombinase XerD
VKGVRRLGMLIGNWVTVDQDRRLMAEPHIETLRTKRNHAMLAMLLGCGLRVVNCSH